jgi:hypothetical protein
MAGGLLADNTFSTGHRARGRPLKHAIASAYLRPFRGSGPSSIANPSAELAAGEALVTHDRTNANSGL